MTKKDYGMDLYPEGAEEALAQLNEKLRLLPEQSSEKTLSEARDKAKATGTVKARAEYAKLKREMGQP